MTADLFDRYAGLDPAADPAALPDWTSAGPVLLAAIDERTGSMQTQPTTSTTPRPPKRRFKGPLVAAAAFALVIATAGIVMLLASGDDPQPVVTDESGQDVSRSAGAFADAINRGDPAAVLGIASAHSNCDFPSFGYYGGAAGGVAETCEQLFGHLIGTGTDLRVETCTGDDPVNCTFAYTTEVHTAMGYPGHTLRHRMPLSLDREGGLIMDWSTVPPDQFMPEDASSRLFVFMQEHYPEMNVSSISGPEPKTFDSGVAMVDAARQLNDPERIVEEFQQSLDRSFLPSRTPRACITQDGSQSCQGLLQFLYAIGSTIDLDCDVAGAESGPVPCLVTVTSDVHEALGSDPTITKGLIEFRGGMVTGLTLDLAFATDPDVHEGFLEYARTVDGLYGQTRPLLSAETAPAWVAAAEAFAGN